MRKLGQFAGSPLQVSAGRLLDSRCVSLLDVHVFVLPEALDGAEGVHDLELSDRFKVRFLRMLRL